MSPEQASWIGWTVNFRAYIRLFLWRISLLLQAYLKWNSNFSFTKTAKESFLIVYILKKNLLFECSENETRFLIVRDFQDYNFSDMEALTNN